MIEKQSGPIIFRQSKDIINPKGFIHVEVHLDVKMFYQQIMHIFGNINRMSMKINDGIHKELLRRKYKRTFQQAKRVSSMLQSNDRIKRMAWGPMAMVMGVIGGTAGIISLIQSTKNTNTIITLEKMMRQQNELLRKSSELTVEIADAMRKLDEREDQHWKDQVTFSMVNGMLNEIANEINVVTETIQDIREGTSMPAWIRHHATQEIVKQVKDKLLEMEVNTIPGFSSKQLFQMPFSVEAHDGLMVISIHVPTYEQHNDLFTTYEWVEVPWKVKNGTTLALIPKPTKTFIAINNDGEFMEINQHEMDGCHDITKWRLCAHGRLRFREGYKSCLAALWHGDEDGVFEWCHIEARRINIMVIDMGNNEFRTVVPPGTWFQKKCDNQSIADFIQMDGIMDWYIPDNCFLGSDYFHLDNHNMHIAKTIIKANLSLITDQENFKYMVEALERLLDSDGSLLRAENIGRLREAIRNIEAATTDMESRPDVASWRWTSMVTLMVSAMSAVFLVYTCLRAYYRARCGADGMVPVDLINQEAESSLRDDLIGQCVRELLMAHHNFRVAENMGQGNAPIQSQPIAVAGVDLQDTPQQVITSPASNDSIQLPSLDDFAALTNLVEQDNMLVPLHLEQDTSTFIKRAIALATGIPGLQVEVEPMEPNIVPHVRHRVRIRGPPLPVEERSTRSRGRRASRGPRGARGRGRGRAHPTSTVTLPPNPVARGRTSFINGGSPRRPGLADSETTRSDFSIDSDLATNGSATTFVMPRPPPPITPGPLQIFPVVRPAYQGVIPIIDEPLIVARFRTVPREVRIGTSQQIRRLVYALRIGQDMEEIPRRVCHNGLPQYLEGDPTVQPMMDILGRNISTTDHVPAISLWSGIWENLAVDEEVDQAIQGEDVKMGMEQMKNE